MVWRGHWANGNSYIPGDVVSIGNHTAPYYLCYVSNTNKHPRDNPSEWHVLGQVSLATQDWASNVNYRYGDMVKYSGDIYICITSSPNLSLNDQPDTSTSDWKVLSGGATGAPGASVEWRGAYSGATAYDYRDAVSYNGASYIAKSATTGNVPTNTTYWDLMAEAGQDGQTTNAGVTLWNTNGFRLTLESGVPDDDQDRTGKTTIYWTPYISDAIALFDGTNWNIRNVSERSIALGTLVADTNYDVFVYDNAGTPTLQLGPAWTNSTTRSVGIERRNGVWVMSGTSLGAAGTRRYLGTFRTTSTTTTENSQTKRFLYNVDNALPTQVYGLVGPVSFSYTGGATEAKFNLTDADSTSYVLIGVGGQRMLDGQAGAYGYSGTPAGDARIFVSISTDPAVLNAYATESTLVQSTSATWTWVEAERRRLPQGLNYVRLCVREFSAASNLYAYAIRNFSLPM